MAEQNEDGKFKVRDKRLFNPDGSLRDTTEDEPEPAEPSQSKAAPAQAAPAASTSGQQERESSSARSVGSHLEPESRASKPGKPPAEPTQDDIDFINFMYGLASNAFANLGVMPNPVTGETNVDLETAKHFIDIIGLLEKKTKGNLSAQEEQIVMELLRDLRMQYVSMANAPQE